MEVSFEQCGSLLIPIIMSNLTSEMLLRIARESKGDVWKIKELMEIARSKVKAKEMSESTKVSKDRAGDEQKLKTKFPTQHTLANNEGANKIQ